MKLERILKTGIAFGFLGLGILGCANSKKELDKGIIFEQKKIDYKGNLSKVADGIKIDASFSNPKHYCFYGEGRANGILYSDRDCHSRVGLWTDAELPKETNSNEIANSWLSGPYLQEVGIKDAEKTAFFNESTAEKRKEIIENTPPDRRYGELLINNALEKTFPNSETRLTDYFHDDGKPEAFVVPTISEKKFGVHVFFDKDYIKIMKHPEVAMVYDIAGKTKAGDYFSYMGKLNLKKINDAYCGYFEISKLSKYRTIFLMGNFKKKDKFIPIAGGGPERRQLIENLNCSKEISKILGDDDCIMLGFSEKLYD